MAGGLSGHRYDMAAINSILRSPGGAVARDVERRGRNVLDEARRRVPVDRGELKASLRLEMVQRRGVPVARIGSDLYYAWWVHRGTGIYGPHRTPIVPVRAKYLRFRWRKRGNVLVYARSVRGMRGVPYLTESLDAAGF